VKVISKSSVRRSAVRSIAWLDGRATISSNSEPLLGESACFNSFWSGVIVGTKRNRNLRTIFKREGERLARHQRNFFDPFSDSRAERVSKPVVFGARGRAKCCDSHRRIDIEQRMSKVELEVMLQEIHGDEVFAFKLFELSFQGNAHPSNELKLSHRWRQRALLWSLML
jgi:hypothetical protein